MFYFLQIFYSSNVSHYVYPALHRVGGVHQRGAPAVLLWSHLSSSCNFNLGEALTPIRLLRLHYSTAVQCMLNWPSLKVLSWCKPSCEFIRRLAMARRKSCLRRQMERREKHEKGHGTRKTTDGTAGVGGSVRQTVGQVQEHAR